MKQQVLAGLFLVGLTAPSFAQLVGILEDDREETRNWQKGPAKNRVVRPLFEKKGDAWVVSRVHERQIDWLIAFDGKSLGKLASRPGAPSAFDFKADSHVPLARPEQSLRSGRPSTAFSGWQNALSYRPLVLVSGGKVEDPDQWKRWQPTPDELIALRKSFRAAHPKVINCDKDENPLPAGAWRYNDGQISVAGAYRSRNGEAFVSMWLSGGECGVNDGPFVSKPFLFQPNKPLVAIRLPSRNGGSEEPLSLVLVDAGDYDGDGKSELLFFVSGYNEDGYALLYDSLRKSVLDTWSYH